MAEGRVTDEELAGLIRRTAEAASAFMPDPYPHFT
jgi:hypothetical protein